MGNVLEKTAREANLVSPENMTNLQMTPDTGRDKHPVPGKIRSPRGSPATTVIAIFPGPPTPSSRMIWRGH